jgi:hypothetical protein
MEEYLVMLTVTYNSGFPKAAATFLESSRVAALIACTRQGEIPPVTAEAEVKDKTMMPVELFHLLVDAKCSHVYLSGRLHIMNDTQPRHSEPCNSSETTARWTKRDSVWLSPR